MIVGERPEAKIHDKNFEIYLIQHIAMDLLKWFASPELLITT